jgi:peptidoglycan/xylan/chitin deacetylase (PgdA/CDA1 family)
VKTIRILALVVVAGWTASVSRPSAQTMREIAFTFDDLPASRMQPVESIERFTRDLLDTLQRHKAPAIGFVNEGKLRPNGQLDDRLVGVLRQWRAAGMELGNHTYGHLDLHQIALADVEADVLRGEVVTRQLLAERHQEPRFFRHPYLHTGRSIEIRQSFETFLKTHGYRVAPVSIDNSDYVFAAAYDAAGEADRKKIAAEYVEYMKRVVTFYEGQATMLLGRDLKQVLLVHASALNGAAFDALATHLESRGYRFIALDRALEDPAYALKDDFVGPGGISWIHRWAITQHKPATMFKGDPTVPEWIARAADRPREFED